MVNPFRWFLRKLTLIVFNYIHTRPDIRSIYILGRPFEVYPKVYNPGFSRLLKFPTTEHLAKYVVVRPGEKVLDMGTGIGVQAVFASLGGADVIATDILPVAVDCAIHNAQLNQVNSHMEVRLGDLFEPVAAEYFDLIIWLAPSFFSDPIHPYQAGWMCGTNGSVLERFCTEAGEHLNVGGRILFSCVDRNRQFILTHLKEKGFNCKLIAPPKKRFPFETITLYEARLSEEGQTSPVKT